MEKSLRTRPAKASIVKDVSFEQKPAVGRLRTPEKASEAQGVHKQRCGRRKFTRCYLTHSGPMCDKELMTRTGDILTKAT